MKIYKDLEQWTPEWLELRKWKLTWTKLKTILWYTEKRMPKWMSDIVELIADQNIEDPGLSAMEVMERGNYLEKFAKEEYENIYGIEVEEVWFVEDDSWYIGLSPDGLIDNGVWEYEWAIEIKSPLWKKYVRYLLEWIIPNEYRAQVINYFLVIDTLDYLDFCIYNPDVYGNLPKFHVIRITRKELSEEIAISKQKILEFREKWLETENTLFSKYENINEEIMVNPTHYYTAKQAGEFMQMHGHTVRTKCRSGDIKAKNIGTEKRKQWRIHWEDIINFLK